MTECYIWDTPATMPKDSDGDSVYFDSPRAGGKYKITGSAASTLGVLDSSSKARLTTWLCDQRRAGVEYPAITVDRIDSAKSFRPLTTTERLERILLYFNKYPVGSRIYISADRDFAHDETDAPHLAAISECASKIELSSLMEVPVEIGWLSVPQGLLTGRWYVVTANGWLKIDELMTKLPVSTQAFVAMWFNEATHAAYTDGIEPAIADCGYRAVRIDKKEHNNKIDDEIIAEIRRSKFLVADFTCEKEKVRGGVYFEAGFAMGMQMPVIWTVAQSSISDLHFDTRQYNHIVWDTPSTLRSLLKSRIGVARQSGWEHSDNQDGHFGGRGGRMIVVARG